MALLRKRIGMTQQEIAKKLGVKQNTVSQWESGQRNIPSKLLPILADALHCTIDELFGQEEPKKTRSGWTLLERKGRAVRAGDAAENPGEGVIMVHRKWEKPANAIEIGRRLADYPPEGLYHLGLVTLNECRRIVFRESHTGASLRYRRYATDSCFSIVQAAWDVC